jgi:hypothetical protein
MPASAAFSAVAGAKTAPAMSFAIEAAACAASAGWSDWARVANAKQSPAAADRQRDTKENPVIRT